MPPPKRPKHEIGTTRSNEEIEELEEMAADMANTIDWHACRSAGVQDQFLTEWSEGVFLKGGENAEHFFMDDYPCLKENAAIAADELQRLTDKGKILYLLQPTLQD